MAPPEWRQRQRNLGQQWVSLIVIRRTMRTLYMIDFNHEYSMLRSVCFRKSPRRILFRFLETELSSRVWIPSFLGNPINVFSPDSLKPRDRAPIPQ